MPFRIRSHPSGYPIRPPVTAEELGAAVDFPAHLAETIQQGVHGGLPAHTHPELAVPSGVIVMWSGLLSAIPSGWVLCDGANGTPNLLDRFVKSVPNAQTNPGATGGALSKTTAGHYHAALDYRYELAGTGGVYYMARQVDVPRTTTVSDTISDIRPPYFELAFVMKT